MSDESGLRAWRRATNLRSLTAARDLLRAHGFGHVEDYVGGDPGWLWHPPWATVQREAPRVLCLHESDLHAWEGVAVDDTRDTLALVERVCGRVRDGTLDLGPYEDAAIEAWLWWARDAGSANAWVTRWAERLRAELERRGAQVEER